MAENKAIRLSKAAREFNVGISTIVEFLNKKGHKVEANPNTKLEADLYNFLVQEYSSDLDVKKKSEKFSMQNLRENKESVTLEDIAEEPQQEEEKELLIKDSSAHSKPKVIDPEPPPVVEEKPKEKVKEPAIKVVGKVDLDIVSGKKKKKPVKEEETKAEAEPVVEKEVKKKTKAESPKEEKEEVKPKKDVKIVGKVDLDAIEKPKKKKSTKAESPKAEKEEVKDEVKEEVKVEEKKSPIEVVEEKPVEKEDVKEEVKKEKDEMIPTVFKKLSGPRVVGKIVLPEKKVPAKKKPVASSSDTNKSKKKRRRISKDTQRVDVSKDNRNRNTAQNTRNQGAGASGKRKKKLHRPEVNEEDVQKQIKETLAKLTSKGGKTKTSKYRREKRETVHQKIQDDLDQKLMEKHVIKVTEFVSVSELSTLMEVPVNKVIQTCMTLGLFVSINQRLDAETLTLVAEEFNFIVEFVSVELQESLEDTEEEKESDLHARPPIVTVMGHVDHGKTKFLDYVRSANVIDDITIIIK